MTPDRHSGKQKKKQQDDVKTKIYYLCTYVRNSVLPHGRGYGHNNGYRPDDS